MTAIALLVAVLTVLSVLGLSMQMKRAALASSKRIEALEAAATKEICEPLAEMPLAEITERMKAIEPKAICELEHTKWKLSIAEAHIDSFRERAATKPGSICIDDRAANGPNDLHRQLLNLSGSEFYLLKGIVKAVSRERSAKS